MTYRTPSEPDLKPFFSSEIEKFAHQMDRELKDNSKVKPDWKKMNVTQIKTELESHTLKLKAALDAWDLDKIQEHAADVGVIAMFLSYRTGALDAPPHPEPPPPPVYNGSY